MKMDQSVDRGADLDRVEGFSSAVKVMSMTIANGAPRISPIEGVTFRPARQVSHGKGHLTEVYRNDWDISELPIVQINATTTFPGEARGWGLHRFLTERLFAATGSFCIAVFDGRIDSPTHGAVNQFFLGERNQGLIVIPPGLWHGWKNIGPQEAMIISMASRLYDHEDPDRWELPWDSAEARAVISYRWAD